MHFYWGPLQFQTAALLTIAVPAALLHSGLANYRVSFAVLMSAVTLVSTAVPPLAGAISDGVRRAGGSRRSLIVSGAAIDAICLLLMAWLHSGVALAVLLLLATAGMHVSMAAYQALIPEIVPRAQWGAASGYRGGITLLGEVAGLAVAGTLPAGAAFVVASAVIAAGALTMFGVREGRPIADADHARVRDRRDFTIVFTARSFVMFGLTLLMTFILYFFHDVLHFTNPSAGTGLVAGAALIGAVGSSIWLGVLSDRAVRKEIVALAGVPMAIAAAGFGLFPEARWMFAFAVLFGLGYGGIVSVGWALAIDAVPHLRDVARDLGLWGVASNIPAIVAPLFGGWLLARYGGSLEGYRLLFMIAAACFGTASLVVLRVGTRRPG